MVNLTPSLYVMSNEKCRNHIYTNFWWYKSLLVIQSVPKQNCVVGMLLLSVLLYFEKPPIRRCIGPPKICTANLAKRWENIGSSRTFTVIPHWQQPINTLSEHKFNWGTHTEAYFTSAFYCYTGRLGQITPLLSLCLSSFVYKLKREEGIDNLFWSNNSGVICTMLQME